MPNVQQEVICCEENPNVNCACPEPPVITPCSLLVVCCSEYVGVDDAWKKTGIPPHRLRFMAGSPAFPNVYWA